MYINRILENKFTEISKEYSCILLTGPRQIGKTTMLRHLMKGTDRKEVSLDDLEERKLAKEDPAMFLKIHPAPVLIDEVQYAPELFSYIKIAVDNGAEPGSFWLTGSQAFRLMELAHESLAGRTAILELSSLSQAEISGATQVSVFRLIRKISGEGRKHQPPHSLLKFMSESGKADFPDTSAVNILIEMCFTAATYGHISIVTSLKKFRA